MAIRARRVRGRREGELGCKMPEHKGQPRLSRGQGRAKRRTCCLRSPQAGSSQVPTFTVHSVPGPRPRTSGTLPCPASQLTPHSALRASLCPVPLPHLCF